MKNIEQINGTLLNHYPNGPINECLSCPNSTNATNQRSYPYRFAFWPVKRLGQVHPHCLERVLPCEVVNMAGPEVGGKISIDQVDLETTLLIFSGETNPPKHG